MPITKPTAAPIAVPTPGVADVPTAAPTFIAAQRPTIPPPILHRESTPFSYRNCCSL